MKFDNKHPDSYYIGITYIDDIQYMPKSILEFIKLIGLGGLIRDHWELRKKLELILKGTLEEDLKEEVDYGIILYFASTDGNPFYVYKPLRMTYKYFQDIWLDEQIE